jgi:hypothetical protein
MSLSLVVGVPGFVDGAPANRKDEDGLESQALRNVPRSNVPKSGIYDVVSMRFCTYPTSLRTMGRCSAQVTLVVDRVVELFHANSRC